jgi:hypothetical protein
MFKLKSKAFLACQPRTVLPFNGNEARLSIAIRPRLFAWISAPAYLGFLCVRFLGQSANGAAIPPMLLQPEHVVLIVTSLQVEVRGDIILEHLQLPYGTGAVSHSQPFSTVYLGLGYRPMVLVAGTLRRQTGRLADLSLFRLRFAMLAV